MNCQNSSVTCHLEQSIIDSTIDQWREWLTACLKAEGRHFEYQLAYNLISVIIIFVCASKQVDIKIIFKIRNQ